MKEEPNLCDSIVGRINGLKPFFTRNSHTNVSCLEAIELDALM